MKRWWKVFGFFVFCSAAFSKSITAWRFAGWPPCPANTALVRGAEARGRRYWGHQEDVTVVPLHPPRFRVWLIQDMCSHCLCLRGWLSGITIRLWELCQGAAPGSQTEEMCAQDSAEPNTFWGNPLVWIVIFHVNVTAISPDMNSVLQGSIQ